MYLICHIDYQLLSVIQWTEKMKCCKYTRSDSQFSLFLQFIVPNNCWILILNSNTTQTFKSTLFSLQSTLIHWITNVSGMKKRRNIRFHIKLNHRYN